MERLEGESFEDYKKRRKAHNEEIKNKLKPKAYWPSRRFGTYSIELIKKLKQQKQ